MPFDLATARPVGQKETMSAKDVVSKAIVTILLDLCLTYLLL